MTPPIEQQTAVDVVKGASLLNHLKNNRIEYLIGAVLLHSLGVLDTATTKLSGVCF